MLDAVKSGFCTVAKARIGALIHVEATDAA